MRDRIESLHWQLEEQKKAVRGKLRDGCSVFRFLSSDNDKYGVLLHGASPGSHGTEAQVYVISCFLV